MPITSQRQQQSRIHALALPFRPYALQEDEEISRSRILASKIFRDGCQVQVQDMLVWQASANQLKSERRQVDHL